MLCLASPSGPGAGQVGPKPADPSPRPRPPTRPRRPTGRHAQGRRPPRPTKAEKAEPKLEKAVFAGGCFWCLEAFFERVHGVKSVVSGYAGGTVARPSYEMVCTGLTGHAEAVAHRVRRQRRHLRRPPRHLLDLPRPDHPEPPGARRGHAVPLGHLLRQRRPEEARREVVPEGAAAGLYANPIVTQLVPLVRFWPAEKYHQDYYRLNNNKNPYCQTVIAPKIADLKEKLANYKANVKREPPPRSRRSRHSLPRSHNRDSGTARHLIADDDWPLRRHRRVRPHLIGTSAGARPDDRRPVEQRAGGLPESPSNIDVGLVDFEGRGGIRGGLDAARSPRVRAAKSSGGSREPRFSLSSPLANLASWELIARLGHPGIPPEPMVYFPTTACARPASPGRPATRRGSRGLGSAGEGEGQGVEAGGQVEVDLGLRVDPAGRRARRRAGPGRGGGGPGRGW